MIKSEELVNRNTKRSMRILALQKMLEGRGEDDLVNSIAPLSPKRPMSQSDNTRAVMSPTGENTMPISPRDCKSVSFTPGGDNGPTSPDIFNSRKS